jgi:hypothetical protein
VREILVARAAARFGAAPEALKVEDGTIVGPGGARVTYGELVAGEVLHVTAKPVSRFKDPKLYGIVARPRPRIDIPAKVTGGEAYVHDMRLPGMLHARVVRPPSYKATLEAVDTAAVEKMPRVVRVVRDGNFLAVVAEREWGAVKAMRALAAAAKWREEKSLPDMNALPQALLAQASQDVTVAEKRASAVASREDARRDIYAPFPGARLDRALVRRGADGGRQPHRLEPHPGRLLPTATRSPRCSACRPTRCAACIARDRAATGTTAPTTPRPMRRFSPR